MGEQKKASKARVPAAKINSYWGFKMPKNLARKGIRVYKRVLALTDSKEAAEREARKFISAHADIPLVVQGVEKYINSREG